MNKKKAVSVIISITVVILGLSPLTEVKAQDNILNDLSYLYLEKLVATAKENYPRVKVFNSQVNQAKSELSGAKLSWLEPFSFQYVGRSNQPNTNVVDVTTSDILTGYQFGISISPGALLSKPGQIKRAKEQVKIAQYNQDEYALQLESEVKRRYFTYLQYKTALPAVIKAFSDAEDNFNSLRLKYQKAEATLEDYNTASMSYNQAIQAKIGAQTSFLMAKVALEELTVSKLEEIK